MRNQKHKTTSIASTETNFALRQAGGFIGPVKVAVFRMQPPGFLMCIISLRLSLNNMDKSLSEWSLAKGLWGLEAGALLKR